MRSVTERQDSDGFRLENCNYCTVDMITLFYYINPFRVHLNKAMRQVMT
jgi:hypothetical protein